MGKSYTWCWWSILEGRKYFGWSDKRECTKTETGTGDCKVGKAGTHRTTAEKEVWDGTENADVSEENGGN